MTGDDNHDGDHPETSNPLPPIPPPTQQIPHIVSSIKLPILKKGEYDIWAMKMEHYLSHTDYPIAKGIKTAEEEMLGTMETKLATMVEDLHIRMIQKLWLPLMERILTGLDILKKLYGEQRDKLGNASVEITAYSLALKKESDLENTSFNDRYVARMHAVPPPMTGNYIPSGPDVEIDYCKFTYGPKQTSVNESDSKPSVYASCKSDSSVEITTSMPDPVENAPKLICEPKVWTDAPIIEEYESDSDNDSVSNVQEDKENLVLLSLRILLLRPQQVVIGETKEILGTKSSTTTLDQSLEKDDPHRALKDKGIIASGCSRHMTGNKAHIADYQVFKDGSVAFGGSNGRITGKGKIKAGKLDFKDVYYMEELKHYNLFSVS
nr:ribonuclease H-like domain-containing protein [Tanacetum cinerariifolium]